MNTLDAIKKSSVPEVVDFLTFVSADTITDTVCGENCPFNSICNGNPLCEDIDQIRFQTLVFLTLQSDKTGFPEGVS